MYISKNWKWFVFLKGTVLSNFISVDGKNSALNKPKYLAIRQRRQSM